MYSDGITEAETPAGAPFDESGLEGVIAAWANAGAPEITAAVLRAVERHVGDGRFADDLTVSGDETAVAGFARCWGHGAVTIGSSNAD